MLYVTPEALSVLRAQQTRAGNRERRRSEERAKRRLRELSEGRFAKIAAGIALILRAGVPTRFEYEGACRHGVRRSLILQGWQWADADAAALAVIAAAFQILGVERPSWIDGQPEAAANIEYDRHWCIRCGTVIPGERKDNLRTAKYCGDLCAKLFAEARTRQFQTRSTRAEWLAAKADQSAATIRDRSGNCEHCDAPFITHERGRRFCSKTCSDAGRTFYGNSDCAVCGTTFRGKFISSTGRMQEFCSIQCQGVSRRVHVERTCRHCRTVFSVKGSRDRRMFCSDHCRKEERRSPTSSLTCEPIE